MEYFPRTHNCGNSLRDSDGMTVRKTRPEEFEDRIIFISMFNDIDLLRKFQGIFSDSEMGINYAERFPLGHLSFLGPGEEEDGVERNNYILWNSAGDVMVANFQDSGHPFFRASNALDRDS